MRLEWVRTVWQGVVIKLIKYVDELEGTLRGHIGLIEEALDRLEGKATEADRGKKM